MPPWSWAIEAGRLKLPDASAVTVWDTAAGEVKSRRLSPVILRTVAISEYLPCGSLTSRPSGVQDQSTLLLDPSNLTPRMWAFVSAVLAKDRNRTSPPEA